MSKPVHWLRNFAVRGVFWRHYHDWAMRNLPFYLTPVMVWFWTSFFFFLAAPARRALVANLAVVLPASRLLANYLRAWRVMCNFAWTIAEGSHFKQHKSHFAYELKGAEFLDRLGAAPGAIVLTAHMGSYDFGAALFAEKFKREIRMVRAPEPDQSAAQHLDQSLAQTGAGGVRVDYNAPGNLLSFDLLNALRNGEIVSIQGDRVPGGLASANAKLFGRDAAFPIGPFILAQAAGCEIFPLFIVRIGYRRYKIITDAPFACPRSDRSREADAAEALQKWCGVLENMITRHWDQWYAFVPMFASHAPALA